MDVDDVKENIVPPAKEELPEPYEILFLKTAAVFDSNSPPPPIPPKPLSLVCPAPRLKASSPGEAQGSRVFVTSTTVKQSVAPPFDPNNCEWYEFNFSDDCCNCFFL